LWGTLARKAKGILDEDGFAHKFEDFRKEKTNRNTSSSTGDQVRQQSASEVDLNMFEKKVYLNILTVASEPLLYGLQQYFKLPFCLHLLQFLVNSGPSVSLVI